MSTQLEPYNDVCWYMKGLSHVAMGQFYEGIKAQTKTMLNDPLPGQKATTEYLKVKYLQELETYSLEEKTQLYLAEIDVLYKDLTTKGKILVLSAEAEDLDAVCNLILSFAYYFYNLMPLSRGSSVVVYSIIMGALIAGEKEISGKITNGKLVDFEAMTARSAEDFSKIAKDWLSLRSISPIYKNLLPVSESFPTLRTMIEVLTTDSSHCLKRL